MTRTVARPASAAKNRNCRIRQPNCTTGNQISPLVAALKTLLPQGKAAWQLHILTGQGLSTCQKILAGHRPLNLDVLVALLRSEHGWTILKAVMSEAEPAWFEELAALVDISQIKRDQLRLKRDIERRELRLLERSDAK